MKRYSFSFFVALAMVCSCQIQEFETPYEEDFSGKPEPREIVITASLADVAPETKTLLERTGTVTNSKYKVYWLPGDQIRIFSAGESGVFTSQNTEPSITAPFKGSVSFVTGTDENGDPIYAWGIYPSRSDQVFDASAGTVQTYLPPVQAGKADSYADDIAIMLGRSTSLSFAFKNAYSGLRVKLGCDDIVSMSLRSNGGEALAGRVTFGLDSNNKPVVQSVSEGSSEVTLYAPDGNPFESGKFYYFVTLPDVALSSGITLTLRRKDGTEGSCSVNAGFTLERNLFSYVGGNLDEKVTNWQAAETQGVNEIWYTSTDGQVVEYNGDFESNTYDGKGVIRFNSALTTVPAAAFKDQTRLSSVTLPEMVTTISNKAFYGCSSLQEVNMSDQVRIIEYSAFQCCNFQGIRLSEGLQGIGYNAFSDNPSLASITIPETVISLGYPWYFYDNPFAGCSSLESFYGKYASPDHLALLYVNNDSYGDHVFLTSFAASGLNGGTYRIPDGVTSVTANAFFGAGITGVDLNDVTQIWERAFADTRLQSLTIPSAVKSIGAYAFAFCDYLTSIRIEGTDTSIPTGSQNMFYGSTCPIIVPAPWLEFFKTVAPWSTYSTRYVAPPSANQIIYYANSKIENTFTGTASSNDFSDGCGVLTFSSPVTDIPANAFQGKTGLTAILLPEGIVSIGRAAFAGCSRLTAIELGKSVKVIHNNAFFGCTSLSSLTLSEGLEYICYDAFKRCYALQRVTLPSTLIGISVFEDEGVPSTSNYYNAFSECTSLTAFYGNGTGFKTTDDHKFLLSKDGKLLISGAIGGFVGQVCSIPSSVQIIGCYAMCGGEASTLILIDSPLHTLYSHCFESFTVGSPFFLPSTVITIQNNSFTGLSFTNPSYGICFQSDALPSLDSNALGGPNDSFPISIPGYATIASNSKLENSNNVWNTYKTSGRIHVYQDDDEIWYLMPNGSTKNFSNLNFGTESSPVYAANGGNAIYQTSYVLEPLCGGDSFDLGDGTCVSMQLFDGLVKTIPDGAFDETDKDVHCTNVWLPSTVTSIGANAFKNCSKLEQFPLHKGFEYSLRSIGEYAFFGCMNMVAESINANNVTSLGEKAFNGCTHIQSITLGGCNIPNYAFNGCSGLQSVLFEDVTKVTSLGGQAFAGCTSLTKVASTTYGNNYVYLPNVTTVGFSAFYNCSSITRAYLPKATLLATQAFYNCTSLVAVSLQKVQTIEAECFKGKHKLTSLTLNSIITIGADALGNGIKLSTVTLGPNITSLTNSLFSEYEANQTKPATFKLVMNKTTPPAISQNTFANLKLSGTVTPVEDAFKVQLPNETVRNAYVNLWKQTKPFSLMTNAQLATVFIYPTE